MVVEDGDDDDADDGGSTSNSGAASAHSGNQIHVVSGLRKARESHPPCKTGPNPLRHHSDQFMT